MLSEFGRYLILKKIAVGGMAEIFLARRVSMGHFSKFVVLKRLSPEYQGKRSFERLFLHEARLTGRLSHPNVVQLHDIGQVDGSYFMAMEYIHGVSSAEMMSKAAQKRKPVPLGVALGIVRSTARALAYCGQMLSHEGESLDLLHHDISPHNIQIRFDGEVKLLDFGVATQSQKQEGSSRRGKFAYMSPEAFNRNHLDQRSDLFSLGVVFYELTMGRRLFKGKSQQETKQKAEACNVPNPRSIHPQFPEPLERLVLKALSPDRDDRFTRLDEFVEAIDLLRQDLNIDCSSDRITRYLRELYGEEIENRMLQLQSLAARAELIGADALDEINTLHPREKPPINLTGKPIGKLPTSPEFDAVKTPTPFGGESALFGQEILADEMLESIDKEPTPSEDSKSSSSSTHGDVIPPPELTLINQKERDWDEQRIGPTKTNWLLWAVVIMICSAGAFLMGQKNQVVPENKTTFIINSNPPQGSVLVDEVKWGETPLNISRRVSSTQITVQVKKVGFESRSTLLKVPEGGVVFLEVDLTSKPH
jgi:serine/threonine-protein kinase